MEAQPCWDVAVPPYPVLASRICLKSPPHMCSGR